MKFIILIEQHSTIPSRPVRSSPPLSLSPASEQCLQKVLSRLKVSKGRGRRLKGPGGHYADGTACFDRSLSSCQNKLVLVGLLSKSA